MNFLFSTIAMEIEENIADRVIIRRRMDGVIADIKMRMDFVGRVRERWGDYNSPDEDDWEFHIEECEHGWEYWGTYWCDGEKFQHISLFEKFDPVRYFLRYDEYMSLSADLQGQWWYGDVY